MGALLQPFQGCEATFFELSAREVGGKPARHPSTIAVLSYAEINSESVAKDGRHGSAVALTLPFAGHTLYVKQGPQPTLDMASTRGTLSNKIGRHTGRLKAVQKGLPAGSEEYTELEAQCGHLIALGQSEKSLRRLLLKPVDADSQVSLAIGSSSRNLTVAIQSFLKKYQLPDIGDDLDTWLKKYKEEKAKLHTHFEPQNLRITTDGNSIFITYETKTGKKFQTTLSPSGHPIQSKGFNLSLTSLGRGKTQDPANKLKNADQNSAHIVANWFGGSGYKKSLNLLATSDKFNKVVMGGIEEEIVNWLKSEKIVTFDLQVDVEWGVINEPNSTSRIVRDIQNMYQLPASELTKAQKAVEIQLKKFKPILKAVQNVIYDTSGVDSGNNKKRLGKRFTGPDHDLRTTV